jgi:hypothetical protein
VDTEFVVMCADDDFIIPDGISDCLHFLKQNRDFAAAQGNCIGYKKDTVASERISFSAMYTEELSFQIVSTDPFERLRRLFNPYRTIFCAVHYTKNLGLAYNEKMLISNLFLNEYVSGIIPIVSGKFAELPVFYQVREFAEDSADKTTDNFDMIVGNPKYKTEYEQYLEYIADLISSITGSAVGSALEHVKNILNEFAESLRSSKMLHGKISFKKKIGLFISQVPFIGKALILKSRDVEKKQKLSLVVKSARDKDNLNNVEVSIRKYANAIQ